MDAHEDVRLALRCMAAALAPDNCPSVLPRMREQDRVDLLQKLGRPSLPVGTPLEKGVFGSTEPDRGKYIKKLLGLNNPAQFSLLVT
jgi:hypothetical protein